MKNNNLASLLDKWQPSSAAPKEQKQEGDSCSFDMEALQYFNEEPTKITEKPVKVPEQHPIAPEQKNPPEVKRSAEDLNLNDDEIMEFFNRIETNKEPEVIPPERDIRKEINIPAPKEDINVPLPSVELFEEEPIINQSDKAECVFSCGDDFIPERETGDILQHINIDAEFGGKIASNKEGIVEPEKKLDWKQSFEWDKEITEVAKSFFGLEILFEKQREIINAAKSGKDVLGIIPKGKGLIYQICAQTDKGITFVIKPQVNKIQETVNLLNGIGISAEIFNESILSTILINPVKIIYVAPEKLNQMIKFIEKQMNIQVARFVILDSHCISKWGTQYRPEYSNLFFLKEKFPKIPILALTENATVAVKEDIITQLKMENHVLIQEKAIRDNLIFEVRAKAKVQNVNPDIGVLIKKNYNGEATIIYCNTRDECEQLSKILRTNYKIPCEVYAEGSNKNDIQTRWIEGKFDILLATSIDFTKDNVHLIIHNSMPKSIIQYIQDCSHAGLDGKPSHCVIYYDFSDKRLQEGLILQSEEQARVTQFAQANIYKIMDYCEEQFICRKKILLDSMGEEFSNYNCKDTCDNCKFRKGRGLCKSVQKEASIVIDTVKEITLVQQKNITLIQLAEYLHGKNRKKVELVETPQASKLYGALKHIPLLRLKEILLKMLLNKV